MRSAAFENEAVVCAEGWGWGGGGEVTVGGEVGGAAEAGLKPGALMARGCGVASLEIPSLLSIDRKAWVAW